MGKWQTILWAAAVSYALRALPFLAARKFWETEGNLISSFSNYAVYGVVGSIIYSGLYGDRFYHDWMGHFDRDGLVKIGILFLAILVSTQTKSVLKTLVICLVIYAFLDA